MLRWLIAFVLVVGCGCNKRAGSRPRALTDQSVTVVGENYCLGCDLAKRAGASSRCEVYGHRHTLRIESILDAQGQAIRELVGETLHYLDTDRSAALVDSDDFHDKRVRVRGHLYVRERTVDVQEVNAL